ncbi:carboxymuconolactone decarboxylase family protein [Pseudomaricurvus sp. HS19]|uniref:carboxymuconolactone decarboxylase family protein n=1 Tax=Pseudomaricurvus sp. HS19 TaxID=2692626 RepID=UPI001367C0A1|nr:carboxymuconolactone decarboxylase family protein [Pseudomaricurvus sp. HS19]MYM62392.1 hypothetical protein [Pseudomaricurvus sp. HS19]
MSDNNTPRHEVLLPPDWSDEARDALGQFPGAMNFVVKGWDDNGYAVRGTNMLGAAANFPALTKAFMAYNNQVVTNSSITTREREIIILRLGWLAKCEYEYVMHLILGRRAGLTDAEIAAIEQGPDSEGLTPEDADLVRMTDEVLRDCRISDTTWQRLAGRYTANQIMDMIFLVGCYNVLAMYINTFRIPVEESEPALDEDVRARMMGQS